MARRKQTKGRKFSDRELAATIDDQLATALGADSSELSNQRAKAMEYYLGEPYGNEMEGQSTVRTREVMDTIEWIKPELMKIFSSGQDTVRFEPQGPEDIEQAQQATDYVNYIFNRKNPGFKILYQWITDGLLQKDGVVKVWWEDSEEWSREDYEGLSELEYQMLAADDNIEIIEYDTYEVIETVVQPAAPAAPPQAGQPGVPEGMGAAPGAPMAPPQQSMGMPEGAGTAPESAEVEVEESVTLYNVAIKRRGPAKGIQIEPVPPEEFLIAKGAKDIQSAAMCAHRTKKTISDLNAMGYDTRELEDYYAFHDEEIKQARHSYDDTEDENWDTHADPTMRKVMFEEVYIRLDYDRDGIAEIRKVCKVGPNILANEEVDCMPFAGWTPIIISHKFNGLSMADLVMDLQLIQSQLLRNMLNNQYLTNNGRYAVVEGQVNIDDLLTSRAHGVVRQKMPGAVTRLDTPQLGASAFQMLEYMDRLREKRTGVSERQQGIDPNALAANQKATAVNQIMTAAQQRIELIARVFAETGLTDLFRLVYKMVIQNDNRKQIFKLRDKYIEVNPSEWKDRYDTSVVVGLGNGSKQSEMQMLQMIHQTQMSLSSNPAFATVAGRTNVFNALEDMVKVYSKSSSGRYFTDPESPDAKRAREEQDKAQQAQQQQAMQLQQAQLKLEEARVQLETQKVELQKMEIQQQLALKDREVTVKEGKLAQDDSHHDDEIALKSAELEMEAELERVQGRGVSLG